ncbi:MAG: DUF167 domain-containing protein [Ignavibacteriales bacterium]|nr:DUF167 domain-containing protein [Ignavibacteriales bacterium]
MKISVKVKPNARKNTVEQIDANNFVVCVSVPPVEGKANEKVIELLADHFGKPKRCFTILRGTTGKTKIVEIA